ncbi:transglutaminase-like domain-containing protein [Psychrobacillus sp. FSL K6-4615]|uniref:transglutaminase-like domain-containing protein n=1 Tax=Psychrobacillus sp. FSL K6-4615 TaxID=2921551 RepID=UPI0030F593CE
MCSKFIKGTIITTLTMGLLTFQVNTVEAASKVMWGKTELKAGQTGKVTILKATPLVKINSKGGLTTVRMLKKGEEYRTYQYKAQNGGLYGVGSAGFVQKNPSAVKYATPSKEKLAQVNKGKVTAPVVKPEVTGTQQFKNLDDLKKIAKDLYNNPQFQPKEVVVYTKTDLKDQFTDYSFLSSDISQNIQGYTFFGRSVEIRTDKISNGVYKNRMLVVNDYYEDDEILRKEKMDAAEKYIVENYKLETDYDVVAAINDFVVGQLEYGGDIEDEHQYLIWWMNNTVCTGYTDLMSILLDRFGIESRLLTGDAHAWNAVKVGGNWYYTDATYTDNITRKDDRFILFTQSQRDKDIFNIETDFKATNVEFDQSMAKAYNYKEVKKAQVAKK